MSDMIRDLGADPFELPYGQVLTGLATKPIDGCRNYWRAASKTASAFRQTWVDFEEMPILELRRDVLLCDVVSAINNTFVFELTLQAN